MLVPNIDFVALASRLAERGAVRGTSLTDREQRARRPGLQAAHHTFFGRRISLQHKRVWPVRIVAKRRDSQEKQKYKTGLLSGYSELF